MVEVQSEILKAQSDVKYKPFILTPSNIVLQILYF